MFSRDGNKITVQHLPPEALVECANCRELVAFRVIRTQAVKGDDSRRYAYLECPNCGARATQLRWARSERRRNSDCITRRREPEQGAESRNGEVENGT